MVSAVVLLLTDFLFLTLYRFYCGLCAYLRADSCSYLRSEADCLLSFGFEVFVRYLVGGLYSCRNN